MNGAPAAERNRFAFGLLLISLIAFAAFHFLPTTPSDINAGQPGWSFWKAIVTETRDLATMTAKTVLCFSSILMAALLIIAGPFLVRSFASFRLGWAIACIFSFLALCGASGFLYRHWFAWSDDPVSPGFYALAASQAFNLAGYVFIRKGKRPMPAV